MPGSTGPDQEKMQRKGRPPLADRAMTSTERSRRMRARDELEAWRIMRCHLADTGQEVGKISLDPDDRINKKHST